jgi:ATP synthase protein I
MSEPPAPPDRNIWVVFGQLTAVAWEFFGSIVAGALLGYFADRQLGTAPWGLIACTLLGTTTGLYRMVVILRQFDRRERRNDDG